MDVLAKAQIPGARGAVYELCSIFVEIVSNLDGKGIGYKQFRP